ncbi:MAG TPA: alpha/beta hydrolase, partial [Gemmatimonadales bacterium]|nr:alpha/beta hydrolase [Gemmatimonadales bacterium]
MLPTPYGPHPDQTGDLYLPDSARAPLICLWHGGFWRMPYGRNQLDGMAQDLCRAGLAVWNLEYRRIGEGGTPWPATLEDVAAALVHVATLRTTVPELDPARLILMGHSAGGHLAFWVASRARARGMNVTAVIGLAPLLDLEAAAGANLGNGAVQAFLGGAP